MSPLYISKEKISSLLPMTECISLMDTMFRDLAHGETLQPLRSLMRLPNHNGLLGMMPAYAGIPDIIGIKIITVFHGNGAAGYPSHQGVVMLFDGQHGQPLMLFDAQEITAIRTAAASAVATRLLAKEDAAHLAILGTGEQAERHIEAIGLVRNIKRISLWGRNKDHTITLKEKIGHSCPIIIHDTAQSAVREADIICTVTASPQPVISGEWINPGSHLNIVGACTPNTREVDTTAMTRSALFTDRYESLFNEAGEFLIPKKENMITEADIKGEIGEVLIGTKKGRTTPEEITLFKSLGIAAEDLYSAWHIYKKLTPQNLNPQNPPPQ
jgi:ornithine cyclodeaminase/alanine dehydrogenase-like protein (mu-crystallin family)